MKKLLLFLLCASTVLSAPEALYLDTKTGLVRTPTANKIDFTGQTVVGLTGGGGGGTWGSITGTLSSQTDLQSALNAKQATLSLGNFTEATSSVLTISGGTNAIIGSGLSVQVKQANGSQAGYLSSADWTTFNGKQATLANTPLLLNQSNSFSTTTTLIIGQNQEFDFGFGGGNVLAISVPNGTSGRIGAFGVTPVGRQTGDIGAGLVNLGWFSGTPTLAWTSLTSIPSTVTTQASNSTSGYLSSTDWATFNAKGTGNGTVTSVSGDNGTGIGLTLSVNNSTTTPALTLGGVLNKANGGTGTSNPGLIAGSNMTITGQWPNQTLAAAGGGGGGTITSWSFNNGNGFIGSVANASTTPALTLQLGDSTDTTKTATVDLTGITTGTNRSIKLSNATMIVPQAAAAVSHNFLTALSGSTGAFTLAQPAFTDISGVASAAQLPNPSASTLGGVESIASVSHNFLTAISTSGVPAQAQPAFTDISGTATSGQLPATTVYTGQANTFGAFLQTFQAGTKFNLVDPSDVTKIGKFDLSNITTGNTRTYNAPDANATLAQAISGVSHQFLTAMSAQGVFTQAQPAFSDLSGSATAAQLPNPSASTLGGVESIAAVSHQWINTISTSGVPALTQPAFSDISGTATGAQLPAGSLAPTFVTLTDGATTTLTCDATKVSQNAKWTIGGTGRTFAISGVVGGMTGVLEIVQDGTGSRTVTTWPGNWKVINGGSGAVTLSTTAGAIDVLTWIYDGSSYLVTYGKNFN